LSVSVGDADDAIRVEGQRPLASPPARRKPDRSVGTVAFRTGDPATGDFGDAKFIRKFGDVSDDLSAL
jgi:hypothetical protein